MKIPDTPEQVAKDLREELAYRQRQIGICRRWTDDLPAKDLTICYFEGMIVGLSFAIMKIEAHIERQNER